MAIPESRINKMQALLAEIRTGNETHLPTTEVQSLAGKLVNMACVVRRGRIHVCGVFAAIPCAYGKPQVMVTKWMKSNLE